MMNLLLSRTLKTFCAVVVAGVLIACGSSSTYQPFVPTRVVGLGDGYNDPASTVREAGSTTGTVVGQVAAYFGQPNLISKAVGGAKIGGLAAQIDSVIASNGGFSSGDLVVITIGTFDVMDVAQALITDSAVNVKNGLATNLANELFAQVSRLQEPSLNVKHILIMPILDVSRTPWGRANSTNLADATNILNSAVLGKVPSGYNQNPVIYANASGITPQFLVMTTPTSINVNSAFTDTGVDTSGVATTPACGAASVSALSGCDAVINSAPNPALNTSYGTMLFADGLHLTPAGNRWVASYLYNATAQGWR